MGCDMEAQDKATGQSDSGASEGRAEARARVRALLFDRLDQAGMVRPRRQSAGDHDAMRARLCERLAYLDPVNLQTLAELIVQNAVDRPRGAIWSEAAILTEAKALQTPPPLEFPIVSSWLASIEGPPAIAGGFEVELGLHLARTGRPPLPYDLDKIKLQASDNARRATRVREQLGRGAADSDDRQWLEWYLRQQQRIRAIIDAGQDKRAAQGKSAGRAA